MVTKVVLITQQREQISKTKIMNLSYHKSQNNTTTLENCRLVKTGVKNMCQGRGQNRRYLLKIVKHITKNHPQKTQP